MPNAPTTGWTVESQQETVGDDGRGAIVEGIKVYFVTGGGHRASVFVAKTRYNPDNVRAAVAAAAAQMDQVGQLHG